ncbi:hypothetical protein JZ751_006428 [Albula glossodonta]|uniref:Clathrin interactor 1 n=1 Tax=Albula glossodonta TaxID=121402 RepID=A0A8T2N333_9TELE|nr:hypothetical protein JZ751_006428 [Albula glossodonta]
MFGPQAGERYDSEPKSKWDEDWDRNKGAFPFSEKLGEISDKIGSTIDDTINKFRKKDRDDSPDRFRYFLRAAGAEAAVYFSFLGELEDHFDNEEDRDKVSRNGRPGKSEFKDEEETVTTKSVQIVQSTETTATRKRGGVPSRTVDLGAAAHYTGDAASPDKTASKAQTTETGISQPSSSGLVNLLMVESTPSQPATAAPDLIGGFADFSSPAASASFPSAAAPVASDSNEFGDWNAFPDSTPAAPAAAPTPVNPAGTDLFASMQPAVAQATTSPSADLFDLMGPSQTTISSSQSLNFSMSSNAALPMSRSQPLQNLGDPMMPQQMGLQKAGAKPSLPSTWSDPSVNISLDFLSPGMQAPKPSQPTLNTMMQQQGAQPQINMVAQSFTGLNLSMQPMAASVRPPANPMMPSGGMTMGMMPNMGMGTAGPAPSVGMAANQGMMGMNMNMGMPSAGMAMPSSMGMGMAGMGMSMGAAPAMAQPKQDAFANFANFGK